MKWYQTSVALAATMYVYADNPPQAAILCSEVAPLTLDASQRSCFIHWIGDEKARSRVHFCSDMTISNNSDDAAFLECDKPKRYFPPAVVTTSDAAAHTFVPSSTSMRFSVDVLLTTKAYIRAASENQASDRLSMAIATSAAVSVDDPCWLHQGSDRNHAFRLSPRIQIVQVGSPVKVTDGDTQEAAVVDGVVEKILAQANRDRKLMKLLQAQASDMRKRGIINHGWMSEGIAVEAMLRIMVTDHYRRPRG